MGEDKKTAYVVQSVEKAVRLLQKLAAIPEEEIGVNALARKLDYNKNQTFRLLKTLEYSGLVEQNENTNRYRLGLGLFSLAGQAYDKISLVKAAGPVIDKLAQDTGETIHLAAHHQLEAVIVDVRESTQHIRLTARLGGRYPLHAGACPRAILAYLPPVEQKKVLDQLPDLPSYTDKVVKEPELLKEKIIKIRKRGYSSSDGDIDPGARSVGAPILNREGYPLGAVSVAGPSSRVTMEIMDENGERVQKAAQEIASRLGFN